MFDFIEMVLYNGGVSQLNGGDYSLKSGQKHHIHLPESAYSINQNYRNRKCIVSKQRRIG
jgi:hypothetical protein